MSWRETGKQHRSLINTFWNHFNFVPYKWFLIKILLLSRKGFIRNLWDKWQNFGVRGNRCVLNTRWFLFPSCPVLSSEMQCCVEKGKLWDLNFHKVRVRLRGVPGPWLCLQNVYLEPIFICHQILRDSVVWNELRTTALEASYPILLPRY